MKTLMLLGGSQCQLNAAVKAKAMGYRVLLIDYLAHPPAAEICDEHIRVSTFDIPACIEAARTHRIDGVCTTGTDQPVYTAACVAEALGLPSPVTVHTALRATNKRAMKDAFIRYNVPHVPFAFLRQGQTASALRKLQAPLVMKPLDSQGQRGVFKVNSAGEAIARLPDTLAFSREDTALVESYYPSKEITYSGYLAEGRLYPLTLTDRQLINDPLHIGICGAHRYPSIFTEYTEQVNQMAEQVATALGATEGPLYIQFLVGDEGIVVNEAACRVGGAFEDVFIPWLTGFDILEAVIQSAMGQPVDVTVLQKQNAVANNRQVSVQMPFCHPGTVTSITPLATLLAMPGVLAAGYNYHLGSVLPPLENATARFGHCVLVTENGDMDERVLAFYKTLEVLDENGRLMVIPRTYDGEE